MAHTASQHIGHGFEPAMGVIGEARDIVTGHIGAKFIQQQKGIKLRQARLADDPGQAHPGAVVRRHAADQPVNLSHCLIHGNVLQVFSVDP